MDKMVQKRNESMRMFIEDKTICYFGDVDLNRGFRETLGEFLGKWSENGLWNFSYSGKCLGLRMPKGVYEDFSMWGMGNELKVEGLEDGSIRWTVRLYGSREFHADGCVRSDELFYIDRRVFASKLVELFGVMLSVFGLESEIITMANGAHMEAQRAVSK
jgi:hypothetical protein